ncbi:MAG: hypothetical protein KC483_04535 [Nitrosarchaeum sp.]|nr:hypothetical protein [Nitrosarchaeum sp.]MCA9819895.1 hypothetical protein [Nitrosarchaeum sp.]
MSSDITKKAVDMLLKGATLLKEPCPYCQGVRVMKEGYALCIKCGKEPEKRDNGSKPAENGKKMNVQEVLEAKLEVLSKEFEAESDHQKQQKILESINSVIDTLDKIKKKQ